MAQENNLETYVLTHNAEGIVVINQASIDLATKRIEAYIISFNKATNIIYETINGSQVYVIFSILTNPMVTWKKLQDKSERNSKAEL